MVKLAMDGKLELKVVQKAIIKRGDKVLIIRRSDKDEHSAGKWEFPGGKLEMGEELDEGLKREVREETGMEINIGKPYATQAFANPGRYVVGILYEAEYVSGEVTLSEEHVEFQWIDFGQVAQFDLAGWIRLALKI